MAENVNTKYCWNKTIQLKHVCHPKINFEIVNKQKTARLTNLKDKYRYGTQHSYYQAKNLEMPGLKSAT